MKPTPHTVGSAVLLAWVAFEAAAQNLSVTITRPGPGERFDACSEIMLGADVQIPQGAEFKSLRFYRNGLYLMAASKAPYEAIWKNAPPGYHVLTALLQDKAGNSATSDPVPIFVGNAVKGNLVSNGEFECGKAPWQLSMAAGTGAAATWMVDTEAYIANGAAAMVDITNGGTLNWHVQLWQPIAIDSGRTYQIYFTAMSTDMVKSVDVVVQMNRDPWTVYFQENTSVETVQEYGPFSFTSQATDHNAYLSFAIGATSNTTFWLDDVKWIDVEWAPVNERRPVDATEPEGYPVVSNFPNPFNAGTTFQVQLPLTAEVSLVLYNLMGQKIRTLLEGSMQAGDRSVAWDGADDAGAAAPSGVYLAVLRAQGAGRAFIATRKILRLD